MPSVLLDQVLLLIIQNAQKLQGLVSYKTYLKLIFLSSFVKKKLKIILCYNQKLLLKLYYNKNLIYILQKNKIA